MKKSELKELIREAVGEVIAEKYEDFKHTVETPIGEDTFARHHPEGDRKFGDGVPGAWDNPLAVHRIKSTLENALESGDFPRAHKLVDELSRYHN